MTCIPLITAAEGFPALERLAAGAQTELLLSFRIIDPTTRLRDPDLRAQGLDTWSDLFAMLCQNGVQIRLLVADFDALFAQDLHRNAWTCASGFANVAQGDCQILIAPHGQQAGGFWHLSLRPKLRAALQKLRADDSTRLTPVQRKVLQSGPILRPVTLHQKFACADGKRAIIGGLDINERRFDDVAHDRPADETWHDIAVDIDDPDFASALSHHFAVCWNAALDSKAPALAAPATRRATTTRPQGRTDLRVLRTYATSATGAFRLAPQTDATDHETALIRLFSNAQSHIYIETQFLRHAPLTQALCSAAKAQKDLQLVLLLPAAPDQVLFDGESGWDQRHGVGLQAAQLQSLSAAFGHRLAIVTPAQPRPAKPGDPVLDSASPIYLHSKLVMIDGRTTVIGSANLNGRSMLWDSEASALIHDAGFAASLMQRLNTIWLRNATEGDPTQAATWRDVAQAEANRAPIDRQAYILPYPMQANESFGQRRRWLPDAMF